MRPHALLPLPMLALAFAAAGCADASAPGRDAGAAFAPAYGGVETRLLDGDLVNFIVTMQGARDDADVIAYAECAAAQYTLIRGYGFARHVRTTVSQSGAEWQGDAVYTISPALPRGMRTIDAEVTAAACGENKIPTV